jgi:hypothetical protein
MKQLHEIAADAAARFKRLLRHGARKRLTDLTDAALRDEQVRLLAELAEQTMDLHSAIGRDGGTAYPAARPQLGRGAVGGSLAR